MMVIVVDAALYPILVLDGISIWRRSPRNFRAPLSLFVQVGDEAGHGRLRSVDDRALDPLPRRVEELRALHPRDRVRRGGELLAGVVDVMAVAASGVVQPSQVAVAVVLERAAVAGARQTALSPVADFKEEVYAVNDLKSAQHSAQT
jgi:hypothetical protein